MELLFQSWEGFGFEAYRVKAKQFSQLLERFQNAEARIDLTKFKSGVGRVTSSKNSWIRIDYGFVKSKDVEVIDKVKGKTVNNAVRTLKTEILVYDDSGILYCSSKNIKLVFEFDFGSEIIEQYDKIDFTDLDLVALSKHANLITKASFKEVDDEIVTSNYKGAIESDVLEISRGTLKSFSGIYTLTKEEIDFEITFKVKGGIKIHRPAKNPITLEVLRNVQTLIKGMHE